MAEYGIRIRNADGDAIFDRYRGTHRVWHKEYHRYDDADVDDVHYYDDPLDHKPYLIPITTSSNGVPIVTHVTSGGQYVGYEVDFSSWDITSAYVIALATE